MKRSKLIIGSRGSKLALIYAENVKSELKKIYFNEIKIKKQTIRFDLQIDKRKCRYKNKKIRRRKL